MVLNEQEKCQILGRTRQKNVLPMHTVPIYLTAQYAKFQMF